MSKEILLGTLFWAAVSLLWVGGTYAAECTTKPAFTFGVIADVQYADVDSPPQGPRCFRQAAVKLEKCVREFNSLKPEFVIQLGDLVNQPDNFQKILPIYKKLTVPAYHVIGNHDIFAEPDRKKLTTILGMSANYYDFLRNGWRFIVLDTTGTTYEGAQALFQKLKDKGAPNAQAWNSGVDPEQKAWLKKRLDDSAKNSEKVIVFGHNPLYPVNEHNLWNDQEIIDVLESAECVAAYFCGHNHAGNYGEKNGIHYVTFSSMVDTPDQTAWALVEVYPDHLNIKGTGREPSRVLKLKSAQKKAASTQPIKDYIKRF
jgi:3',5'-cyclic AMP phosphodiesterase CpdA